MTYTAYPAYKESGVEWLGQIPETWEIVPLFPYMEEQDIKAIGQGITDVLSLSYGNLILRDVENNFGLRPESFDTYQVIKPGNIILRLTDLQNDHKSLRVGLAKQLGIITSAYVNLKIKSQFEPQFVYYLLHCYDLLKVFYGLGGGVRQSMKYNDLKHLPLCLPPLSEQRAIAAFLDRETARIDTLIAKQQRMIELLKERRSALITAAVTGKIDVRAAGAAREEEEAIHAG